MSLLDKGGKTHHLNVKYRVGVLLAVDIMCFLVTCWIFVDRAFSYYFFSRHIIYNWLIMVGLVFLFRLIFHIYKQMWRYANTGVYLLMLVSDLCAGIAYLLVDRTMLRLHLPIANAVAAIGTGLLATLSSRFIYQSMRKFPLVLGKKARAFKRDEENKIKIGIVGAGELGVLLAEELRANRSARYAPYCFFDNNSRKIGSTVAGLPVYGPDKDVVEQVKKLPIQEIIIALPNMDAQTQRQVFNTYKETGLKVKIYDYPLERALPGEGKRTIREVNIEDLLFRESVRFEGAGTDYYRGKTVLITGAGGSIGSELSRQIAHTQPERLVLLDIYENGVYDIQQELVRAYREKLDVRVVIASICDEPRLREVFDDYHPDVVFHAAAHKHVPLMEYNCAEAVRNNVFGSLNVINLAEESGVQRFVMISTDKAVNPTNIMGATKRLCEMIIQSRKDSGTDFVAVRFGNVLGSNGSVVPLFKRQIAEGGPVTITDKRIIRYFMTIPEAVQLVLRTGRRAEKSEIYVLDMGEPVKILDLAENMIALSGFVPYEDIDVVEIGLRPGEKLYEELLINSDTTFRTEDARIYIDHDKALTRDEVSRILFDLDIALNKADDNDDVRDAMMTAVSTYQTADEINSHADTSAQVKSAGDHNYQGAIAPGIPS